MIIFFIQNTLKKGFKNYHFFKKIKVRIQMTRQNYCLVPANVSPEFRVNPNVTGSGDKINETA